MPSSVAHVSFCILAMLLSAILGNATVVKEGSVAIQVSPSLAAEPGSQPGFYNPRRRVGRDLVVLSVASHLMTTGRNSSNKKELPLRVLDAMCATGMQGIRVAMESPKIAKQRHSEKEVFKVPNMHVVLNDMDPDAVALTTTNARKYSKTTESGGNISVKQRVAQALLYEESFDVSILDPFGSTVACLDAAFSNAPHGGLIELCATDVGAIYGARPQITRRHYNSATLSTKRPPTYRERGIRLLLAAAAQAAGRHDRGIAPLWSVSTEHYCLVSIKVLRRGGAADQTAQKVQRIRICPTCGTGSSLADNGNTCNCRQDGNPIILNEEGPLWVGPIYDAAHVNTMATMAEDHQDLISKETRGILSILHQESPITPPEDGIWFYRRPGVAIAQAPKLDFVLEELKGRGFQASRTHFDSNALRTNASPREFDLAVQAAASRIS